MKKFGLPVGLVLSLLPVGAATLQAEQPAANIVREDWYFRETLAAIRDWEAVLAWWEKQTPEERRTPVFPVPHDGEAVTWTNPIPHLLLPAADRQAQLKIRLAGERIELQRLQTSGQSQIQMVDAGATVLGYKHPGGGGRNQWYHRYQRRFDRLTTLRPKAAPFALDLPSTLDLLPGTNELRLGLRNATGRPIVLTVGLRFLTPQRNHPPLPPLGKGGQGGVAERSCGSQKITLAGDAAQVVSLPVDISATGGGLLLLAIDTVGASYWLPLFTHVEDLPAVLTGIQRILADQPDATAQARLSDLRRHAANGPSPPSGGEGRVRGGEVKGKTWRTLFEEASALRDDLLLRRLNFERMLFVKRKPFYSEQPFMDAHHCYNRPGGGIYCLAPVRPDGQVTPVVDSLPNGLYRDLCLHWDAQRLLFAFGNGADRPNPLPGEPRPQVDPDQRYHLFEVGVGALSSPPGGEGKGKLRQLTSGLKNDCEPIYLPNGQVCFTSDRSEHFVMCGSNIHVANLHVMNGDGQGIRQLSYNVFNEFQPSLLPDGRILYTRWEYNERSVTSVHNLFTIRPDGSQPETFFGNASIRPNVFMFGRPVPGSHKVTALFTGHHGQTHGPIGLIDPHRGQDGLGPITVMTPGIPITAHAAEDSYHGWFSDPVPLSETTYLCSFTPTVLPWLENTWALYVGDRHGNLALIQRDQAISLAEPLPLVRRPAPKNLAAASTTSAAAEGELVIVDVTRGLGGIPRGTVKFIRILEDKPRKCVPEGGVIVTSGTSIYTTKRIIGTVPVEPDGSAYFKVPADRNVYFQVLDDKQREIQRMRSVVCLKSGERRSCIGCHEKANLATPNKLGQAFLRPPSRPTPPPWGTQSFSFLRDLQPILDAKCVSCHAQDRKTNKVILTGDLTDQFSVGYQELLPYLSVANAMRFDNPEDVYARPPYTYGSKVSRLTGLLEKGHHGVQLNQDEWVRLVTWIDTNAVYYDRYESTYGRRQIFTGEARKVAEDVFRRRCASCHTDKEHKNGGQLGSWWLSLNCRDLPQSRALRAPLAGSAGGWERCSKAVFASTADADYQLLLRTFTRLGDALKQRPREDLLSLVSPYEER